MNKHINKSINMGEIADHVLLIVQSDWSVSFVYVTQVIYFTDENCSNAYRLCLYIPRSPPQAGYSSLQEYENHIEIPSRITCS